MRIPWNSAERRSVGGVRTLEAQGVTHIFAILGAKIDGVFNALVDSKIETVVRTLHQKRAPKPKGLRDLARRFNAGLLPPRMCPEGAW